MIIIEEGKRYVRRDGGLSDKIRFRKKKDVWFPFTDGRNLYAINGRCCQISGAHCGYDLISEYKEPSMKEIDFSKPLRFTAIDKAPVHYIGLDKDGKHMCQKTTGMEAIFVVDQWGKSAQFVDIENVPEKFTQWCNFYPSGSGGTHATREQADRSATSERIACVPVTFEPGEGL